MGCKSRLKRFLNRHCLAGTRRDAGTLCAEAAFADFGAPLLLNVWHTETRGRDVGFVESGFRPYRKGQIITSPAYRPLGKAGFSYRYDFQAVISAEAT
jgi:hypothetical protein